MVDTNKFLTTKGKKELEKSFNYVQQWAQTNAAVLGGDHPEEASEFELVAAAATTFATTAGLYTDPVRVLQTSPNLQAKFGQIAARLHHVRELPDGNPERTNVPLRIAMRIISQYRDEAASNRTSDCNRNTMFPQI